MVVVAVIVLIVNFSISIPYLIESVRSTRESRAFFAEYEDQAIKYAQNKCPDEKFRVYRYSYYDFNEGKNTPSECNKFELYLESRQTKCKVLFQRNDQGKMEMVGFEIIDP